MRIQAVGLIDLLVELHFLDNGLEQVLGVGRVIDAEIGRKADFFNRCVKDIMTKTPKTVSPQTKISEIQKIMNKNKIHNVLVSDSDNKLLGIVDRYACIL